jgi:hypothetical protein
MTRRYNSRRVDYLEDPSMRNPAVWKVAGAVVLAIVLLNLTLGVNLLPSFGEASEKGTFAALLVTWGMVMVCAVSGVALAAFLFTARRAR